MNELPALLVTHRPLLRTVVLSEAGGLLRFEWAEDLVQGIHLRALERGESFVYRSEPEWLAWLRKVAKSYLNDRRSHWSALRRRSGRLLRYTVGVSETADPRAVPEPAGASTGPSTFAARRELIELATKTLDLLLPRDRRLVRSRVDGLSEAELGKELGLSAEAAGRARRRALDRYRDAFRLISGSD